MSDHIPEEVMANILLRLSVKDLVSCRRVSKQWLSIIDDPHFISRQLQHSISSNSNAALFLQHRGSSPVLYWKRRYDSDISFFSTLNDDEPTRVLLMGSCHGLVCFSLFDYPHDLVVLNPSTGERHTVRCPMVERREYDSLQAYGFGYDELSDDYKAVRIIQTCADRSGCTCSYRAEINGVRSNGFSRTIPFPAVSWRHYSLKSIGVFVGGSVHWCTSHSSNPNNPYEHVIDAIDLVSNTYHMLLLPYYNFDVIWDDSFNVGIVDTRLSLCCALKEVQKIVIWVMDEYGNPKSWNRLYYVDYHGYFPYAVTSVGSNGDKIQLMIDWQKFSWCDPTKNEVETILFKDTKWRCGSYEAMYCLDSLVKIFPNQAAVVKKEAYKKQLERLSDQELPESGYNDLRNLNALMYEDYSEPYTSDEDYEDYD